MGLHGRSRWRLPLVLTGLLLARGRRTVSSWLRAAQLQAAYTDYYYFNGSVGRKTNNVATRLRRSGGCTDAIIGIRVAIDEGDSAAGERRRREIQQAL